MIVKCCKIGQWRIKCEPYLSGLGGYQVVGVLAFCSDNMSSNPAEVYNFSIKQKFKASRSILFLIILSG